MNNPFWLKMEQIFVGPTELHLIGLMCGDIFYAAKNSEMYRILYSAKPIDELVDLCDVLTAIE